MSIHLYTLCWNDAEMLPFMFRHYDDFVEKYFVFDDGWTDGSVEILRAHPRVRVDSLPMRAGTGSVFERCLAQLNNCWKESIGRANWVIVTDIDEHLFHSDMHGYFDACKRSGITIIPSLGYQMISTSSPQLKQSLQRQ